MGQAQALAAAMTDTLATKHDLRELETRIDARCSQFDTRLTEFERRIELRFEEQERRIEIRFSEQAARFGGELASLERRMTMRLGGLMMAGIAVVSALDRLA